MTARAVTASTMIAMAGETADQLARQASDAAGTVSTPVRAAMGLAVTRELIHHRMLGEALRQSVSEGGKA
jgi:hypothetical protein